MLPSTRWPAGSQRLEESARRAGPRFRSVTRLEDPRAPSLSRRSTRRQQAASRQVAGSADRQRGRSDPGAARDACDHVSKNRPGVSTRCRHGLVGYDVCLTRRRSGVRFPLLIFYVFVRGLLLAAPRPFLCHFAPSPSPWCQRTRWAWRAQSPTSSSRAFRPARVLASSLSPPVEP